MPAPLKTVVLAAGLGFAVTACNTLPQVGADAEPSAAACGADSRQEWVGQSVAALNDIDLPEGTRVLFPTTPATMDFNAARLNVAVDASDIITRVYCG